MDEFDDDILASLDLNSSSSRLSQANSNAEGHVDQSSLFKLPLEVRLKIFEKLLPPERMAIRLVNFKGCNEIDQFIGVVDMIWLRDEDSNSSTSSETSGEILEFLRSSKFKGCGINALCIKVPFQDVIGHPLSINSICLGKRGVISPDFAITMLSKCINITELTWTGSVSGDIFRKLHKNDRRIFPKLKKISIDGLPSALSKTIQGANHLDNCWKNQLALLKAIWGPSVKSIDIRLISLVRGEVSETYTVLEFLLLHTNAESVNVTFRKIPTSAVVVSNQGTNLALFTPKIDMSIRLLSQLKIKRLCVHSTVLTYNVILPWLEFIKGLKNLDSLTFKHVQEITWSPYVDALCTKFATLVSLNLSGRFTGPIDFSCLKNFQSLKVLRIHNRSPEDPSPVIHEFGPYFLMMQTLEVLIIINFRLLPAALGSITGFRKLKHLALDANYDFGNEGGLSFDTLKEFLTRMRSLESIMVDAANMLVASVNNDSLINAASHFLSTLQPFIKAGLLLEISDTGNCPYWRILDTDRRPDHFLVGFEAVFFLL